jgi:hypothetical protein
VIVPFNVVVAIARLPYSAEAGKATRVLSAELAQSAGAFESLN